VIFSAIACDLACKMGEQITLHRRRIFLEKMWVWSVEITFLSTVRKLGPESPFKELLRVGT
jgi:hypothetical protein